MAEITYTVNGVTVAENGEEEYTVNGVTVSETQAAAPPGGQPTMRRWGGVPHMTPGPVAAGRSW